MDAHQHTAAYVSRVVNHLLPPRGKVGAVAVFQAYFDESGISDPRVFTLAGYFAPSALWTPFAAQWQGVLSAYHVKVFHAYECNGFKGEFRQFWDEDVAARAAKRRKRDEMVAALTGLIDNPYTVPFVTAVKTDDYKQMVKAGLTRELEHPYYVCMQQCLAMLGHVMERFGVASVLKEGEKIKCIFDRQDKFRRRAVDLYAEVLEKEEFKGREWFGGITFESKEDFIPLQAADALAFDSRLEIIRRHHQPDRPPRASYAALTRRRIADEVVWDRKLIEDYDNRPEKYRDVAIKKPGKRRA